MDETSINFPEEIWAPYQNPNVYQQFLFPIALGAIWEYPMPQVHSAIEECVKRIGADRIMWGTDMPIVMRFWTYKQNIEFIARHCDFLSKEDTDQIMGGTVAKLLGVDWPESGSGHSVTR
jgi:predicted TIM-barrel fold metal-dependent hydrolase